MSHLSRKLGLTVHLRLSASRGEEDLVEKLFDESRSSRRPSRATAKEAVMVTDSFLNNF